MFRSARIKLTAWYLLIIMCITTSFSVTIYRMLAAELDRIAHMQRLRIERQIPNFFAPTPTIFIDEDILTETRHRIMLYLFTVDLIILGSSAIAGYFLAGRTLQPIKSMVEEQNLFITNASHELRTPLTALKSEIEVNLRSKKLTLAESRKILQSNLEEVNNLQSLSDSLLTLTNYQKAGNDAVMKQICVQSSVEDAIRKISSLAQKKHIEIQNETNPVNFQFDERILTELLLIFLDNAIKYSNEGAIVTVRAVKKDMSVMLSIKDTGIGIRKDDIPHIFDRFYRADTARSSADSHGYGLGLSIAQQIVKRYHGSIHVDSIPNKGTTFIIRLPLKQPVLML